MTIQYIIVTGEDARLAGNLLPTAILPPRFQLPPRFCVLIPPFAKHLFSFRRLKKTEEIPDPMVVADPTLESNKSARERFNEHNTIIVRFKCVL